MIWLFYDYERRRIRAETYVLWGVDRVGGEVCVSEGVGRRGGHVGFLVSTLFHCARVLVVDASCLMHTPICLHRIQDAQLAPNLTAAYMIP